MRFARTVLGLWAVLLIAPSAMAGDAMPDLSPPSDANQSAAGMTGFDTTKLSDDLYSFRWQGTRNIFMVTPEGVIATDPISVTAAKTLRAEIRKVTNQPVKYVVYSHQHWDHALGGKIFKDEGAQFVAHEKCVKHFTDFAHPDLVKPDITFAANHTVTLGGKSLDLIYLGENHGDCLVVMQPRGTKYLYVVDLVTPGGVPSALASDYKLIPYIRSLRAIEAMPNVDTIIPGHLDIAPLSTITERRAYMEALMVAVRDELAKGTPGAEILNKVKLPQFAHMRGYEQQMRANIQRVLTHYNIGW
jgi:glyoxylase-like metal-dependent hydrolase (beta-lactamase superfamily II)